MAWQDPKTIWTPGDPITDADLARIEQNIKFLNDTKFNINGGEVTGNVILRNAIALRGKLIDGSEINIANINSEDELVLGAITLLGLSLRSVNHPTWRDGNNITRQLWSEGNIPFPFSHPGTGIPAGAKLRIQVGTVTASNVPANGGRVHETVVFPETFTAVLGVLPAPQTAYPHLAMSSPNNVTTGNCQITTYNNDTVVKTISSYWVAIGYK